MRKNPTYLTSFAREGKKDPMPTEKIMWQALRNRKQHGLKFRREHPVEGYIADFFCFEHKLIVEIDGNIHNQEKKKAGDVLRQDHLCIRRLPGDEIYCR